MATTKFYLDTRRAAEAAHALRVSICHRTKTAAFPLGIKLAKNQWDPEAKVIINHPHGKYWNNFIARRKVEIDTLILKLEDDDPHRLAAMTAVEIRDYIVSVLTPVSEAPKERKAEQTQENPNSVANFFVRYKDYKGLAKRTAEMYDVTWRRIEAWLGKDEAAALQFSDINMTWIEDFDQFLANTAPSPI